MLPSEPFSLKTLRGQLLTATVLALALTFLATPSTAHAQVSTDVDITMNGVVILHYFSQVNFTVPAASLTAWLNATADQGTRADNLGNTAAVLNADSDIVNNGADMTVDPTGNSVDLHMVNVWAVRSINTNGNQTQVAIAKSAGTVELVHAADATKKIVVNTTEIRENGGAWGANAQFDPPGLFTLVVGDVKLNLDFTGATLSGAYSVAGAGTVYQLTATNL